MSVFAMTLPLARGGLRINRRDLSLDQGEDATIQFTVVDADTSSPTSLNLVSPPGALTVNVWYRSWAWDYGRPCWGDPWGITLWSAPGTVLPSPAGRIDLTIPQGTISQWRGNLAWTAQLTYGGGLSTIVSGALNVNV